MTTKTISGYSSGFTFSPAYSRLSIVTSGTVGGTGVTSGDLAAYSVINSGRIEAAGSASTGVSLEAGGSVANGAASNRSALISGQSFGVSIAGASGTIVNFGTILGSRRIAIDLETGGSISNGPGSAALIIGYVGIEASGQAAITNDGTIDGTGGTALQFLSANGSLIIAPGATFIGKVLGDGSALTLAAGGAGTLSGLGTSFSGFGDIGVAANADWTLTGSNTIAAGVTLSHGGYLINSGTLVIDGVMTAAGGSFTNDALVDGEVVMRGAATLANRGTIDGGGGRLYCSGRPRTYWRSIPTR